MSRYRLLPTTFALAGLLAAAGCGEPPPERAPAGPAAERGKLAVQVVNYPLRYFAERIGGDRVQVELPAPRDVDPAFWSPPAEIVRRCQRADVILLNGAGYARWVMRATLPPSKLVDTSESFRDRYIVIEDSPIHSHGPGGEHSHGEIAFTTWLDPSLAVEHSRAILEAFIRLRPEHEAAFRAGFEALEQDLEQLDRDLRETVARAPGLPLLASHPVYHYLARRYDLDVASVHFEPDEVPAEEEWRALRGALRDRPARWMLWEAAPRDETAARLRVDGVESIVFDPCANTPENGDYLSVMRANVQNLQPIFP